MSVRTTESDDRPPSAVDSAELFRNLIPCSGYGFPFVDRYAQFGVTFDQGRPFGPGMAQVRSAFMTFQVACSALALWIEEEGAFVPFSRTDLDSLPWCVIERGWLSAEGGALAIVARHAFLDEVTLASEFVFANRGAAAVSLRPAWLGQLSGDRWRGDQELRRYGYARLPLRETWAEIDGACVRGGLRTASGAVHLPTPALEIAAEADAGLSPALSTRPLWGREPASVPRLDGILGHSIFYAFRSNGFTLAPGAERRFRFAYELSVASYRDPVFRFRHWRPETVDMDAAVSASRADFERRVALHDPPAAPGQPALQRKLWRARWALLRTGYRNGDKAGEYGQALASTCVPSCNGFTRVFFWDSLFSAVALSKFEPELARGALASVFSRQLDNGFCPEHGYNYHVPQRDVIGAPQGPVAAWALDRYLRDHPDDTAFLTEMYPRLVRNHRYWTEQGDRDQDGLAEWTWSGQTADNSPLFDETSTAKGCGWLPPIASVPLNAFLYRDALLLAGFAERLGRGQEADAYRASAGQRAEALLRICYVPEERRFWDYNHAVRRHCRVKTFYLFWPIWAGMPVPAETRQDLIENVLLASSSFFGDIPFPSVAYDEPSYEPTGYWRGRTWPHISYWLLEMLVAEGYTEAAAEAARRLLAAWTREATFPENLASDPGLYEAAGVGDYNWGIAALYLIGTREFASANRESGTAGREFAGHLRPVATAATC
jgi:hypothetical protein